MNFPSVSGKNWLFKKFDSSEVSKLVENYSLSEIVAKLLSIRNIEEEDIDFYLNPNINNHIPDPNLIKDMDILKIEDQVVMYVHIQLLIG